MNQNQWLADRLKELPGKNQSGLARILGVHPKRITEIIQGSRRVQQNEILPVARYLDMDPGKMMLLLERGAQHVTHVIDLPRLDAIKVRGAVQAGNWVDAMEWSEDDWYEILVAPDPRYPEIKRFGLLVRGPSMNRVYPDGTILICAKLIDLHMQPEPGRRYVILQHRPDSRVEATVKELVREQDGSEWLWPRSDHPMHQAPIRYDGAEEVVVQALVIGSYRPE